MWANFHHLQKGLQRSGAEAARNPLLGDILVVVAQAAAATQFIVEEKYLTQYRVPALLAVSLEGFWGLVISAACLPVLGSFKGSDGLPLDSFSGAMRVCSPSPPSVVCLLMPSLSSPYNSAGWSRGLVQQFAKALA